MPPSQAGLIFGELWSQVALSQPTAAIITPRPEMPRPRLLFLSHLLPYPPDSGAAIRTWNIFKLLARDFEVTALCFYRMDPELRGHPARVPTRGHGGPWGGPGLSDSAAAQPDTTRLGPPPEPRVRPSIHVVHARLGARFEQSLRTTLASGASTWCTSTVSTWCAFSRSWAACRSSALTTMWSPPCCDAAQMLPAQDFGNTSGCRRAWSSARSDAGCRG